jgi:hypothetical protein
MPFEQPGPAPQISRLRQATRSQRAPSRRRPTCDDNNAIGGVDVSEIEGAGELVECVIPTNVLTPDHVAAVGDVKASGVSGARQAAEALMRTAVQGGRNVVLMIAGWAQTTLQDADDRYKTDENVS